jgi:uridylate kinase
MYKRILLKISGELLGTSGFDSYAMQYVASELSRLRDFAPCEIAIVVGGGNLFRGDSLGPAHPIHRADADAVGMIGTVMNAIVLASYLTKQSIPVCTLSACATSTFCEQYTRSRALTYLGEGSVVLCAGGTGNPFFTTDTTAVLRALELDCDVLLKATKVDGVYTADPVKHADASKYETITYTEALRDNLRIMDAAALGLCRTHALTTVVFNMFTEGALATAVTGNIIGTRIIP